MAVQHVTVPTVILSLHHFILYHDSTGRAGVVMQSKCVILECRFLRKLGREDTRSTVCLATRSSQLFESAGKSSGESAVSSSWLISYSIQLVNQQFDLTGESAI